MKAFVYDPVFVEYFELFAIKFLVAANLLNAGDAKLEIDLILDRLGIGELVEAAGKSLKFENEAYIKMNRVGAKFTLDRKSRVNIAHLLSSAINHASVEAGYH